MFPCDATNDTEDRTLADCVLSRQLSAWNTLLRCGAYFADLCRGEFRGMLTFPACIARAVDTRPTAPVVSRSRRVLFAATVQTAARGISGILQGCSQPEMIGSYTQFGIAVVHHDSANGDRPVGQNEAGAMGSHHTSVEVEEAVSVPRVCCRPQPAGARFINLRPEPIHSLSVAGYGLT